jgi:hypothetical protein
MTLYDMSYSDILWQLLLLSQEKSTDGLGKDSGRHNPKSETIGSWLGILRFALDDKAERVSSDGVAAESPSKFPSGEIGAGCPAKTEWETSQYRNSTQ